MITLAALLFDLTTDGTEQPASALCRGLFVRVDKTTLAYRRWGEHGSPVVLLGGAAEPSWVWHDVGPLIAQAGHRVFALDLPPWGYSQRRGPYTMSHWLQLVRGFERPSSRASRTRRSLARRGRRGRRGACTAPTGRGRRARGR